MVEEREKKKTFASWANEDIRWFWATCGKAQR